MESKRKCMLEGARRAQIDAKFVRLHAASIGIVRSRGDRAGSPIQCCAFNDDDKDPL